MVAKQQQHIKRVVNALSQPVVAVVPAADFFAIQPRQLRRKHRVDVFIGVAAQGTEAGIQGDVFEVIQPRK